MPIKLYKPTTAGRRHSSGLTYEELTKDSRPEKSLLMKRQRHAGRNNQGRLTVRHRGGGNKWKYRMIDFKQTDKIGIPGTVSSVEYDPYRTAFLMLVNYKDGEKRYHIAPEGIHAGDTILCKERAKAKPGNRMMLKSIPVGFDIFNIELKSGKGGQMVRSAGSSAKLISLEGKMAQVEFPSKEVRFIHLNCYATVGRVSNVDNFNVSIGKAGKARHMGLRPEVRGKVMNPVDHPHGGGEGRNPIGMPHPKTPWGMPALGFKTRGRKKYSTKYIVRTRKGKQLVKVD